MMQTTAREAATYSVDVADVPEPTPPNTHKELLTAILFAEVLGVFICVKKVMLLLLIV